jgi:alpha-L-arabinofuranosidase
MTHFTRRGFLGTMGAAATLLPSAFTVNPRLVQAAEKGTLLHINTAPQYELSPYIYMQFMEPLGVNDASVAAAWDFQRDRWYPHIIETTRDLAPAMMRWGGTSISYYRWREGVGSRDKRRPVLNLNWGGIESNQVGTAEFIDFCRQVVAVPLVCVNFESNGMPRFRMSPKEGNRIGNSDEAAAWVDYCNNPDNRQRIAHGHRQPYSVQYWQIGNEPSYPKSEWDVQTAAQKTVQFAKAMRSADPGIQLIGWGEHDWAPEMLDFAGEHLQYIAFHNGFNPDRGQEDSPLQGIEYRKDPDRTWVHLMRAWRVHDEKIRHIREQVEGTGVSLAMTEGHFALPGRNRCEVLSTWAAGVANARMMNNIERHGDLLKIATLADFCGTRWQVNAVMIDPRRNQSFLMPAAMVMRLYRRHTGAQAVTVQTTPDGLDVTASRTGDKLYLHVINTNRDQPVETQLAIEGAAIRSATAWELALDPEYEVFQSEPDVTTPQQKTMPASGIWRYPAASVTAVELDIA